MTIECPTDGQVSVDVSDVKAIVFDREGHCEISFICPLCGTELHQAVTPVAMQMAIVESVDVDDDQTDEETAAEGPESERRPTIDPELAESYIEYFRRQLADVEDVEAVLKEIDG